MPSDYVPEEHSLVRYVSWSRLRRDAENGDRVIGVLPQAFVLRENEEYLSSTWLEHFTGPRPDQIIAAIRAIRASSIDVKPKSGFAIGIVRQIREGCNVHNCSIRVIHEATDDNPAHVAVRRWPRDNADLFQLMADELWNELVLNSTVP